METTGMPAATALRIEGPSAAGSGIETTRPFGREATTASIRLLISTMSNRLGAWYSARTFRSRAASRTPFDTTDQKGSDDCPCVTTAMRMLVRALFAFGAAGFEHESAANAASAVHSLSA